MSLLMPLSSGVISALFAMLLASAIVEAQQPTTADQAPIRDTSYIDAQGTAHVTRLVPVPKTISTEAQRRLSRSEPDKGPPQSLADRRKGTDAYTARARVEWSHLCPNQLDRRSIPRTGARGCAATTVTANACSTWRSGCVPSGAVRSRSSRSPSRPRARG